MSYLYKKSINLETINYILLKIYTKISSQKFPISLQQAWEFLTNPHNLSKITPPEMNFKIVAGAEKPLYAGQILSYSVTPLFGIKTPWISEITQVVPYKYFIDVQIQGPYAFWHHQHFVTEIEGGVLMEDIIHYGLPLGLIGQMVHPFIVKPKLEEIFEHRTKTLTKLFGTYNLL